ncbi:hypothetical protein OHA72_56895 [Dactylosporangium sp. NBC_01737]|uniref:hypothetical protein n=1 Tax=Dactylosporangium sp. NBC_01737 TaxID=2975959 RepID=UPI002E0D9CF3|nr:hypothetical protein OHA72_56895 [Dactylosporangium sp. NBC_01737]
MTSEARGRRPGIAARRFGYAVAVIVNLVIMYLLDVRPGWQAASPLTDATTQVIGLVNLSLLAGIVANTVYVFADGPGVKHLGDLTTTTISIVVLVRIWQVFPFDFGASTLPWGAATRALLVVALAGSGIAVPVHAVTLVRLAVERLGHPGPGGSGQHALR